MATNFGNRLAKFAHHTTFIILSTHCKMAKSLNDNESSKCVEINCTFVQ